MQRVRIERSGDRRRRLCTDGRKGRTLLRCWLRVDVRDRAKELRRGGLREGVDSCRRLCTDLLRNEWYDVGDGRRFGWPLEGAEGGELRSTRSHGGRNGAISEAGGKSTRGIAI